MYHVFLVERPENSLKGYDVNLQLNQTQALGDSTGKYSFNSTIRRNFDF